MSVAIPCHLHAQSTHPLRSAGGPPCPSLLSGLLSHQGPAQAPVPVRPCSQQSLQSRPLCSEPPPPGAGPITEAHLAHHLSTPLPAPPTCEHVGSCHTGLPLPSRLFPSSSVIVPLPLCLSLPMIFRSHLLQEAFPDALWGDAVKCGVQALDPGCPGFSPCLCDLSKLLHFSEP